VAEVRNLSYIFQARVTFVHVGRPKNEQENELVRLLERYGFDKKDHSVIFEAGEVTRTLNEIAEEENIDLIVTGALKKESQRNRYFGSLSRNLARNATIPVMLVPEAALPVKPIEKIIISISEEHPENVIESGLLFAKNIAGAKVFIVKESALRGSKFTLSQYYTEKELQLAHEKLLQKEDEYIANLLQPFDCKDLDITTKVVFGHSGFGLVEFANQIEADLMVDAFPDFRLGILDRIFPHDVEYALLDLPCKLLLIH
jgi:nucleotide-binding universal stress UspA family protein